MSSFFQRCASVFRAVVDAPEAERAARLESLCAGDDDLRRAVERMLCADAAPPGGLRDETLADRAAARLGAALDEPEAAAGLPRIEGFRVRGLLGEGGMGAVFDAEQLHPPRRVALKVLRGAAAVPAVLRRFEFEAEILARLRHPGIAAVHAAGTVAWGGREVPWFAMEFVEDARTIAAFVRETAPSRAERVRLLVHACRAVQHAHERGIIHRDLKPDNMLVDREGRVRIIDFGVARAVDADLARVSRATREGTLVGTLQYMSPEQVEGDPGAIDVRTDVHALGLVLHEVLTGTPAFGDAEGLVGLLDAIRHRPPSPPSRFDPGCRGDLDAIVAMATEKDRSRRYASAGSLADDLERHLAGLPVQARGAARLYRLGRWLRRRRVPVAAALVLLAALALAGRAVLDARRADLARRNLADQAGAIAELLADDALAKDPFDQRAPSAALLERAEAWSAANLGEAPEIATRIESLVGLGLLKRGRYADAERMLRLALEHAESARAPEAAIAQARHDLARALWFRGAYDEATALLERAIATWTALGSARELELANSRNDLAACLRSVGRLVEAEALNREVLAARRRLLGDDDPWVAASINNLAACVRDAGRYEEAAPMFADATARLRRLGANELFVARGLRSRADALLRAGDRAAAGALAAEAQAVVDPLVPPGHPDRAAARLLDARLAHFDGDEAAADRAAREAIAMLDAAGAAPALADAHELLARIALAQGALDEARRELDETRARRGERLPAAHWLRATDAVLEAEILAADGRAADARAIAERALGVLAEQLDELHPAIVEARLVGAETARAAGDADAARVHVEALRLAFDRRPGLEPRLVARLRPLLEP